MTTHACQALQQRILETEAAGLTAAEREHLRACPECRAFAGDVADSAPLLAAVARQVRRRDAVELPSALKARVLTQIMDQIGPGAQKTSARIVPVAPPPHFHNGHEGGASRLTAHHERGSRMASIAAALGRWRWAAAACLLLAIASASGYGIWRNRPLGRLVFAAGPTSLVTAARPQNHQGLGRWDCRRGSTLSTQDNAAAIFTLGQGVRVEMARTTSLQVIDREQFALNRGSVWLDVTPGGKGFKVHTPHALVQVTGTHFGVTVSDRETRVEVAEGSVAVSQAPRQSKVTAGLALTASSGGISNAVPRVEGTNLPAWVSALLTAEKVASAGSYLPSIGKRR